MSRLHVALAALALALAACGTEVPGDLVPVAGTDAGPDAASAPPDAAPARPDAAPPLRLSQLGLYASIGERALAPGVVAYTPAHELWTDRADKERWVSLPPGATIDTSDMDHWRFPVGTKLFKQFSVDGIVVETRVLWHREAGDDEASWFAGAFLWDADGSDAVFVPEGQANALGTAHDVPRAVKCWSCHRGEPGRVLGFSALQLSHDRPGPTLASLAAEGRLSAPPAEDGYPLPGDATTAAALGVLHANCGHCHHPAGPAFEDVNLVLRVSVSERDPAASALFASTVGVALEKWTVEPYTRRIVAGDPGASAVRARMGIRAAALDQMPPLGTEIVDAAGLAAVDAWITGLGRP